jgi:UDP-glucose 6-dehydrogenase
VPHSLRENISNRIKPFGFSQRFRLSNVIKKRYSLTILPTIFAMVSGKISEENKYYFKTLNPVMEFNQIQKRVLVEKVKKYFKGNLSCKKIAMPGLAFKPETDGIRQAPSSFFTENMLKADASVTVFDPEETKNVKDFGRR